ncbi:MAG TPA: peptidase S10, partial [Microvirga sp.]|nr:peptidase S10 [Microvirga sp.]
MTRALRLPLYAALCLSLAAPLAVQAQEQAQRGPERQEASRPQRPDDPQRLPPEAVTRHSLQLPGRTLQFTATAGSLALTDPQGAPQA